MLRIETVVSKMFGQNASLLWRPGSPDAVVVDPGLDVAKILAAIAAHELTPIAILNTHGHSDHIAGNAALKKAFPDAPLLIGKGDAVMLSDPVLNLSAGYGVPLTSPAADRLLSEGDRLDFAGVPMLVREIPGHSPGHVVFILDGETPIVVIGGDVLFAGAVGRTDFPGGSMPQLLRGIREKLYTLPDDTVVYPGHGPDTTIGEEKATNPFVRA